MACVTLYHRLLAKRKVVWLCCWRVDPKYEHLPLLQAEAFGRGDAGFGSTSRMVLEAGLTLALQVTGASQKSCSAMLITGSRHIPSACQGHRS